MSKTFYLTVAVLVVFALAAWITMFQKLIYQSEMIPFPAPPRHYYPSLGKNTPKVPISSSPSAAKKGPQVITIAYTDSGFVPNLVTIKVGDTVTFKNGSSEPFWPASNPHPVHTGYPTIGGCRLSTFDACKAIQPGGTWSFQFNVSGRWGFHDHLNPAEGGTVTVE